MEIASNDGYLLQNYVERGIPVLGIDPAPGPAAAARQAGIPVREDFFGREFAETLVAEGVRADVIHANNVLAHVADLQGIVDGIRTLLKDDGVAVIEAPYVRDLIDHCEFDTIYHEHLCYFSVTAVSRLFASHGLTLVDVRRLPTHGGSLRMFVQRTGVPSAAVLQLLAEEQALGLDRADYYRDFAARVHSVKEALKSCSAPSRPKASASPATLPPRKQRSCSTLRASMADSRLRRRSQRHKHGSYVPGVQLPIYDTAKLLESPAPDYVLLLAWNFKDEIMRQQQAYRGWWRTVHRARSNAADRRTPSPVGA